MTRKEYHTLTIYVRKGTQMSLNINKKQTFMKEVEILNSNNLEIKRTRCRVLANEVINIINSSNPQETEAECVITYPCGVNEIEWSELGKYYHKQYYTGDDVNFHAYLLHKNGGFHREFTSGFDDEMVVIILFKTPIWEDEELMKRYKPDYLLFGNDNSDSGSYPRGLVYCFKD